MVEDFEILLVLEDATHTTEFELWNKRTIFKRVYSKILKRQVSIECVKKDVAPEDLPGFRKFLDPLPEFKL